jgi:hypothetical protein
MRNRRRDSRRKLEREGIRRAAHRERQRQAQQKRASIFDPAAPKPPATDSESQGTPIFVKASAWLNRDTKL